MTTGVSATTSVRHRGLRWLGIACMTLWIGAAAAAGRPAHGLIVQLKDTPAHAAAQAAPADDLRMAQSAVDTPHERLRRVLGSAGMNDARLRPVGRAAQLLEFGRVLPAAEAASLAERLRSRPEVAWVVPNEREQRLQMPPNDPMFASTVSWSGQWWMFPATGSSANALEVRRRGVPGLQSAWVSTTGASTAVVAVLDSGIASHPDLDAHVLPGYDFVKTVEYANDGNGRDADASDPGDWVTQQERDSNPLFRDCAVAGSSWHGTIIAGIVAAVTDNGVGVAGSNWDGRVLPVRVAGKCGADVADIVDGMRWAAGLPVDGVPLNPNPARIVNISFGGDAPCNAAYQSAIDELATRKVVVVAAAGNEHGAVRRPASCSGVVAVGALNRDGFKTTYSNFGFAVTVSTVGGDEGGGGAWDPVLADDGLLTLHNLGEQGPGTPWYARVFGTSFSAPIASGVVSLMVSVNPSLTAAQIIAGLRASARPHVTSTKIGQCSAQNPGRCICTTATCGAGILDAAQAVFYAQNPSGYVAPVRQPQVIDSPEVDAAVALGPDLVVEEPTPSGGGGALGLVWLLALGGAVIALARLARRREER